MKSKILIFTCLILLSITNNSCRTIDKLTQFNMDFNQTVVIPSSTGISLPLDILTPALETNSESTFEINNTSKELI